MKRNDIRTKKYPTPIPVYNADGTMNTSGPITDYIKLRMEIGTHAELLEFAVMNLGKADMFLGHEWLKRHNPLINWEKSTIKLN